MPQPSAAHVESGVSRQERSVRAGTRSGRVLSRWNALRFTVAVVTLLAITAGLAAYPKPARVPYRWQLEFDPGHLRLYQDPIDGATYWYFTYTIVNRTGSDQIWAPSLVLFTDQGEILRSGDGVPSRIEDAVRDLLGNRLLETQHEVIGDVFQGKEHAKDGLVVWPAETTDVNELSLFVGGLSGETARVRDPISGRQMILRKTLQRDYLIRGNAMARGSKPIEVVREEWILR